MRKSALAGFTSDCVRRLRGQPVGEQFTLFALPSDPVSAALVSTRASRCSRHFDSHVFV